MPACPTRCSRSPPASKQGSISAWPFACFPTPPRLAAQEVAKFLHGEPIPSWTQAYAAHVENEETVFAFERRVHDLSFEVARFVSIVLIDKDVHAVIARVPVDVPPAHDHALYHPGVALRHGEIVGTLAVVAILGAVVENRLR